MNWKIWALAYSCVFASALFYYAPPMWQAIGWTALSVLVGWVIDRAHRPAKQQGDNSVGVAA